MIWVELGEMTGKLLFLVFMRLLLRLIFIVSFWREVIHLLLLCSLFMSIWLCWGISIVLFLQEQRSQLCIIRSRRRPRLRFHVRNSNQIWIWWDSWRHLLTLISSFSFFLWLPSLVAWVIVALQFFMAVLLPTFLKKCWFQVQVMVFLQLFIFLCWTRAVFWTIYFCRSVSFAFLVWQEVIQVDSFVGEVPKQPWQYRFWGVLWFQGVFPWLSLWSCR